MDEFSNFWADRNLFIDLDSVSSINFPFPEIATQTFILTEKKEYEFPDEWKECLEFNKQKSIVIPQVH
jgi:hypothetical protein